MAATIVSRSGTAFTSALSSTVLVLDQPSVATLRPTKNVGLRPRPACQWVVVSHDRTPQV